MVQQSQDRSSKQFDIVLTGTTTLDATSATSGVPVIETVAHNLGFIPIPLVYISYSSAYIQLPHPIGISQTGVQVIFNNWMWASVDDTFLYIYFHPATTANWGTFPIRYYLSKEPAN